MDKNFDWTVVVTCQGNPKYYKQRNLLFGMVSFAYFGLDEFHRVAKRWLRS